MAPIFRKMFHSLVLSIVLTQSLLDCNITGVVAQSFPLFSQGSYSFTVGSCSAGTYVGQVSASGATSYSTDNSFVITVNPTTGALSLGASIAASTTFNVIARNQYGSTQASVTVNANCGGGSTVITNTVAAPAVNYATLTSPVYAVNSGFGVPTSAIAVDYSNPVVVYNPWDSIYRNGNGNCFGNSCWYGGRGNRWNDNWRTGWVGYGPRDVYVNGGYGGVYNYGGYGVAVQCVNGFC